ncbi:MAG TPA: cupin domain-containing protein [Lysobacter sp.]|nr:cupin domain-containing protein [Lysobacter sp.]
MFARIVSTIVLSTALIAMAAGANATNGPSAAAQQRLTPQEYAQLPPTTATAGTSGVAGIETRVLKGKPSSKGLYTILLTVPAHTRIAAHDHPDERVATVISGTWYFGYGKTFDERALKALPPGSFYTEPPGEAHFARTGDTAVVLQITGVGPTGTTYVKAP